jgi:hypothetical protein
LRAPLIGVVVVAATVTALAPAVGYGPGGAG